MDWNIGAVYLVAVGFHSIMIAIASYVLFFLKYDDDDDDDDDILKLPDICNFFSR